VQIDTIIHIEDWFFLLEGAGLTIVLCLQAMFFGILIGLVVGVARTAKTRLIELPATAYVTVVRGTPLLMQLFIIYYCLPLFGINMPKFLSAALGLSFYTGAYVGEIIKAGLQSVDVGQREAARSLGMVSWQEFRYIVLPQALRVIIPPTFGFLIALVKDSSLVSIIGYIELTRASKLVVARTFKPFTLYLGAAVLYFVLCYGLSRFDVGYLRKRFSANLAEA